MLRRHHAITLQQATRESPTLAHLAALAQESQQRMQLLKPLIPAGLQACLQAGPVEGNSWCLLVSSSAAAAKARLLTPAWLAHLRSQGCSVQTIRLKILTTPPR